MVLAGEIDPARRHPARARATGTSRVPPSNKGKSSRHKVAKRRPTSKEPRREQEQPSAIVDRRGNLHDPKTGNFISRTARAPGIPPQEGHRERLESGRSLPETHTSFRPTASIFYTVGGDTDEDDDIADPNQEESDY